MSNIDDLKARLLKVAEAIEASAVWTHRASTGEEFLARSQVVRQGVGAIVQLGNLLEQVEEELSDTLKTVDKMVSEIDALKHDLAAAQEENRILREALNNRPHGGACTHVYWDPYGFLQLAGCNCWKHDLADALAIEGGDTE